MYANWYALMSYYILALTSSLQSAFYWREDICFWSWGFIAIVILLPFIQLRTFHAISYASFLSTVAIIVAVAIIAAAFITGGTEEQGENFVPATWKVPPQGFLAGYSNLANIIFAYQGQSEFYEMASEMKEPRKFPISLLLSQGIMTFMYLFTALLAYTYGGQNVNGFILYSLPENSMRTVCAILVGIHVIVAYMITNQVSEPMGGSGTPRNIPHPAPTHTHTHVRAHMHTHTCTRTHTHAHTRTYIHAYTRTRTHAHTHAHAHAHTHTHTHTCTHAD